MSYSNIIILGAGRSGTSMVASLFKARDYYFGSNLLNRTVNNPEGYYEDREINFFNDKLIGRVSSKRPFFLGRYFYKNIPTFGQRWLSIVSTKKDIRIRKSDAQFINSVVNNEPFCLKDPRFSYTLNVWKPFLKSTKFICVFRHPLEVVYSTQLFNIRSGDYKTFQFKDNYVLEVWKSIYSNILFKLKQDNEDWLFVDYNELIDGISCEYIERFVGFSLNKESINPSLHRNNINMVSNDQWRLEESVLSIYTKLKELSGHDQKKFK